MTITCSFCDWRLEFPPCNLAARDSAMYEAGRHYERYHVGMSERMVAFDQRLEDLALIPDTRTEVKP